MNKFTTIVLVLLLVAAGVMALTGCGGNKDVLSVKYEFPSTLPQGVAYASVFLDGGRTEENGVVTHYDVTSIRFAIGCLPAYELYGVTLKVESEGKVIALEENIMMTDDGNPCFYDGNYNDGSEVRDPQYTAEELNRGDGLVNNYAVYIPFDLKSGNITIKVSFSAGLK